MNRNEHMLACLAEECDEVGQRVMKALRFGLHEIQSGQPDNNADRIADELHDLIAVAIILHHDGIIEMPIPSDRQISAKRDKIERYMEISRREGTLSG